MVPADRTDTRGVSPVVGVVLMLAIVVVLAGILGGLVLGVSLPSQPTSQYAHQSTYVADGEGNTNHRPYVNVTVTHGRIDVGENFYIVDGDGNRVRWDRVWTTAGPLVAGDYAHIDGFGSDGALNPACEGEVYRLVRRPDDGPSTVVIEVTVDQPAVGNAASHC